MSGHRRLAGYVIVDGTPYGPDDHLPEHIAVRITNPAAWAPDNHPTATAASAPPATVTPDADVPDQPTTSRDDAAVPDTAVPDAAVSDAAVPDVAVADRGAAPGMPDPAVPDEPTATRGDTPSPDITTAGPGADGVVAPASMSPPPRSGKGSGVEAWRAYARDRRVPVPDGAERGDIITACEKAGHLPPP